MLRDDLAEQAEIAYRRAVQGDWIRLILFSSGNVGTGRLLDSSKETDDSRVSPHQPKPNKPLPPTLTNLIAEFLSVLTAETQ